MCEGLNAILVVTYQLTKECHYIPYFVGDEGTTIEATTQLLLRHV